HGGPKAGESDDQAPEEAEHGSGNRATQKSQRDDDDQQQVGRAATHDGRGDDDDLQHRGDEYERKRPRPVCGCHRVRSFGTRTITASREPKSTYGSTWTCWKRSVSVNPQLVTRPIGMPFG